MYPALVAAHAKFERALRDRDALHRDIRAFIDDDPFRVTVDFEPDSGWHVARIQIRSEPTPALSVLYGAVAYQLLHALTLTVWNSLVARSVSVDLRATRNWDETSSSPSPRVPPISAASACFRISASAR